MALDTETETSINALFVLIAGFLCFLLQAGFGMLEVGSVREKVRRRDRHISHCANDSILERIIIACSPLCH
jgi:hypothetical protein